MQETIGQRLKKIRTSRQISLDKAAEATRVRAHYLQALEADNYSVMSSAAQSRGFLRLYADYLGLDLEAAMQELSEADSADAPPAASAPVEATPPPAPVTEPTPPASPADGKPARRPFWARLLRRSVPEEPAAEPASAPEPVSVQESAPEPVLDESPAPVLVPTESAPTRARKPAAKKKPASAAKTSRPKTSKPKTAAKSAAKSGDKKKVSMKRPSKKRR
jgi:transcriptional regulator with XRE-family HTH domain